MGGYIPQHIEQILKENPDITGAELSRRLAIPGRSARRYVSNFNEHKSSVPLLKAAVYDIEVSSFGTEGYAGILIMCCILPLDAREPRVIKLKYQDAPNDRIVLEETREALAEYDILIGHNSAAFDENWLNSKLMFYGLPLLRTHLRFDTYQVAKALAIRTSKSLGNLLDFFSLPGEKTIIYRTSWSEVYSRTEQEFSRAISEIEYHCAQDVLGTRELFGKLYHYALMTGKNPFKLSKAFIVE